MPADPIWRPQAREDLLLIYEFVGLDNLVAAERLLTSIEDKTTRLIHHPRKGPRRPDIRPTIRILNEISALVLA